MRHVVKNGRGTGALARQHQEPPQTSEEAERRWRRFADKPALLRSLLNEQYHLCCYSELRADLRGLGWHIEHVENKSQRPARTFDYQNLAVSALDSENGLRQFGRKAFGGHAPGKSQPVDMERFTHCHMPDCARYFAYLSDGRIVPAVGLTEPEAANAQYTIDLLNLNGGFLVVERRNHWSELEQLFAEHQEKGWDLQRLLQLDLVPTADHKLHEFFSTTRQFFGPLAEQVLQEQAPDLV
ncbi:TIGR02646 family protein [Salmonella enterica]|nr:TIGR02646 family protein [Salmonella enterica]